MEDDKMYDLRLERFFPEEWTHVSQIDWLKFLFSLKLAGYDWRELEDIAKICAFLEAEGLVQRNAENCIRLAPR